MENFPWYHDISRKDAETYLNSQLNGVFLIRPSRSEKDNLTVSYRARNKTRHALIRRDGDSFYIAGTKKRYGDVNALASALCLKATANTVMLTVKVPELDIVKKMKFILTDTIQAILGTIQQRLVKQGLSRGSASYRLFAENGDTAFSASKPLYAFGLKNLEVVVVRAQGLVSDDAYADAKGVDLSTVPAPYTHVLKKVAPTPPPKTRKASDNTKKQPIVYSKLPVYARASAATSYSETSGTVKRTKSGKFKADVRTELDDILDGPDDTSSSPSGTNRTSNMSLVSSKQAGDGEERKSAQLLSKEPFDTGDARLSSASDFFRDMVADLDGLVEEEDQTVTAVVSDTFDTHESDDEESRLLSEASTRMQADMDALDTLASLDFNDETFDFDSIIDNAQRDLDEDSTSQGKRVSSSRKRVEKEEKASPPAEGTVSKSNASKIKEKKLNLMFDLIDEEEEAAAEMEEGY